MLVDSLVAIGAVESGEDNVYHNGDFLLDGEFPSLWFGEQSGFAIADQGIVYSSFIIDFEKQ